MDGVSTTKPITASGNSLVVNVTKEVKMLNLGLGDKVRITIERVRE